jgi:protease-4
MRLMIEDVLDDSSVRAVILRVNSPGGSVSASDQIWYQVGKLSDAGLPVIASFGGLAASGGYYVACAADQIIAEPTTITGSIGVIAQTFIVSDLLSKVGVEPVTILATDSPNKDLGNPMRPWTEKDQEKFRGLLDSAYDIFHERVVEARLEAIGDPSKVDVIADGSIYTASEALGYGLVDAIGYLDDAIAAAESAAGLTSGASTVIVLHERLSFLGALLGIESFSASRARAPRLDPDGLRSWINDLAVPRVMYLMR